MCVHVVSSLLGQRDLCEQRREKAACTSFATKRVMDECKLSGDELIDTVEVGVVD